MTIRIAMWSGPRNISTAMMRAWENRPDCAVIDEPFYACYLTESGAQHPCRDAVLASQPTRREQVVAGLLGLRHHLAGRRGGSVGGWTLPVEAVALLAVPVVTSWLVVAMP